MEQIHHVISNLAYNFDLQNNYLDWDDPLSGIKLDTDFAAQSTYHATFQTKPGQLVFGQDMILNTSLFSDWEAIRG